MLETFTPAVCGSRRRERLAAAGFALGAVGASALLGAVFGLAGSLLGIRAAVWVAAGLALLGAARETGLVRLPLPQVRRQVPERWRFDLPLPVWSVAYGAGLGTGFLTFQAVATFWVACAAAVALAEPLPAALAFSLYGGGRALMVVWPRRPERDATAAVERLTRRRGAVRRANAAALVACAALLAASPAAARVVTATYPGIDPTLRNGTLAYGERASGAWRVLVRPAAAPVVQVSGAWSPSIDGALLAYVDSGGIRVVNWQTGGQVAQVAGSVSAPALDWPLLAFRREGSGFDRIILADLAQGTEREITRALAANDLGRPALRGRHLAWHKANSDWSRVYLRDLATGATRVIAGSRIALLANPALSLSLIVWTEQRRATSSLRVRRLDRSGVSTLWSTTGRERRFWTTALDGGTAYVTRWRVATGAATLYKVRF
jgi:hypothetical protein